MSLEQRYRTALRWYPRSWRAANEDVMVGTLLDVAEGEGRDAPSTTELRDLRRSGRRARADVVLAGPIRDRVAAISIGAGTAMALALLTGQAWAPWRSQGSPAEPAPDAVVWQVLVHPGLWILAAAAALAGWTILSRLLLIATLPASALAVVSSHVSFLLRPSFFTLVMMAVLAILGCIGQSPRRWQLSATAIMVAAFASWVSFIGPFAGTYFPRGGLIDMIASPLPALVLLGVWAVFLLRRRPVAAASVLVAAAPWSVILIADALYLNGFAADASLLLRPLIVAPISVVFPLALVLVARRYARPPWLSPSESSDSRTSASRPSSTR